MKQEGNKMLSRWRTLLVIAVVLILTCVGLFLVLGNQPQPRENGSAAPSAAPPSAETANPPAKAKPTVKPLTVHYDHTLPAVQLDVENIEEYFDISLGKEYSRGRKLVIPYTITPASPLYASYNGSTFGVYIKLCIYVYLSEEDLANEDAEPYYSKEYTVVLKRQEGLQASGAIDVPLKLGQDDVFFRYEVVGCNGKVGTGQEPEPSAEDPGEPD